MSEPDFVTVTLITLRIENSSTRFLSGAVMDAVRNRTAT